MDNPWADPWNETSKKTTAAQDKPVEPKWDPLPTLGVPKLPEPEIEPPSWDPQESVSWTAPTASPPPPLPSWGVEEPSWAPTAPTTSDEIPITVVPIPSVVEDEHPIAGPSRHEGDDHEAAYNVSEPVAPIVPPSDTFPSPTAPPLEIAPISFGSTSPSIKTPRDLDDGFGGFESGLDSAADEDGGWGASPDPYLESDQAGGAVWGSSWGDHASSRHEVEEEQPDEWEAARKQQEEQEKQRQQQDKHVVSSHSWHKCVASSTFPSRRNI